MFRKIIETTGTRFIAAIVSFLIVVLTTQFLGDEGRGIISIFVVNIAFIQMLNGFVGGPALVYLVPRIELFKLFVPSYIWSILSSLILSGIFYTTGMVEKEFAIHLFLLAMLEAFFSFNQTVLLGKEKIRSFNIFALARVVLICLSFVAFLLILDMQDVMAFIYSLYISYMVTFIASLLVIVKLITFSPLSGMGSVLKQVFRYGSFVQVGNFIQFLNYRISYYFLEVFSGMRFVGIYSTGVSLAEGMWLTSRSISTVQYSRISNSDDINYSRQLTVILFKISLLATAAILIPVMLLPASFYISIFGAEFGGVRTVILYLAPGIVAFSMSGIFSHYFAGIGKHYINTISSAIGLVFTLVLGITLIPDYHFAGAAITASASYTASTLFQFIVFARETKIKPGQMVPKRSDFVTLKKELRSYLSAKHN